MKTVQLRDGSRITSDGVGHSVTFADGKVVQLDGSLSMALNTGFIDADGAFFFQRQLEHIKAKSYDVRYAKLRARELFPVSNEGGDGINTITYRTYDAVGMAKIISAYADDLPRADVSGKETTIPVRSVGISYGYNLDEIKASQLTGAGLEQRRANASRKAVEETINKIAFFGDAVSGLGGLFDNPNIPTGPVINPGSGTEWINKTPDQILFDINDLFTDIFETTNMEEQGNTLLIPPAQWSYIMTTPRSANSDTTIAQYVTANSPFLSGLESLIALNECSKAHRPGATEDIMVAYDRSPEKLELEIPVELEYLPVQQKNFEFIIPGRARVAGLNIYYPLSLAMATGI